ncbi:MAG TPA: hypothetical protein VM554_09650 [Acidisarcina sp.]|nr:hypothetical protein [Acidisarcina sp.]
MLQNSQASAAAGTNVSAMDTKCPYWPGSLPCISHVPAALDVAAAIDAQVVSHPASSPQTQAKRRISFSRSRQKRGPPTDLL